MLQAMGKPAGTAIKDRQSIKKGGTMMFKKSYPLQSKSEILLRNIVVTVMVVFFTVFLIIPIIIAFAGSFHEWNPLSGTYRFLGIENYKNVFTSALFGKSMINTVIFSGWDWD